MCSFISNTWYVFGDQLMGYEKNQRHLNKCITIVSLAVPLLITATTLKLLHCTQTECLANSEHHTMQVNTTGTIFLAMMFDDNHSLGHCHCNHFPRKKLLYPHAPDASVWIWMSRVEGSEEQRNKPSLYQVSTNICHQQRSDLNSLSNWYSIHSAYKGSHTFNQSVACCKVQLKIVYPVRWHSSYLTNFKCAGTCCR